MNSIKWNKKKRSCTKVQSTVTHTDQRGIFTETCAASMKLTICTYTARPALQRHPRVHLTLIVGVDRLKAAYHTSLWLGQMLEQLNTALLAFHTNHS